MKILVIDDEESIRTMVAIPLRRRGYEVFECANGADGLELAQRHSPDLVICDYIMSEMDGYQVLLALRENPRTANIPFILMTGYPEAAGLGPVQSKATTGYLKKPFLPKDLLRLVEEQLAANASRENAASGE